MLHGLMTSIWSPDFLCVPWERLYMDSPSCFAFFVFLNPNTLIFSGHEINWSSVSRVLLIPLLLSCLSIMQDSLAQIIMFYSTIISVMAAKQSSAASTGPVPPWRDCFHLPAVFSTELLNTCSASLNASPLPGVGFDANLVCFPVSGVFQINVDEVGWCLPSAFA